MKKLYTAFLFMLCIPFAGANSTLEMIEQLEQQKMAKQTQSSSANFDDEKNVEKKKRQFITLSNGKRVDISDWRIVHFMSSNCPYCRQFDPKLKQLAEQIGIQVITYSFDGRGDDSFPIVFDANEDVLREFFAELPRATPTDFLINVHTLVTLPISQGDISQYAFAQRLDETFLYVEKYLKNVKPKGERQ